MHGYDQINVCMYQICDKAIWKPFPMEQLYQLRQEVKKINMEEVNSGKERYNDFLPNHLQSEICYLMEENENESWIIKVLLENEKSLIHGPSSNPKKSIGKWKPENEISPEPEYISPKKYAKQTNLNTHTLITKNLYDVLCESGKMSKYGCQNPETKAKWGFKSCKEKTTVIISDSMLKRVKGAKLSRDIKTRNG